MPNAWIQHIKDYANEKGITFSCALSTPECRETYIKIEKPGKPVKPVKPVKGDGLGENIFNPLTNLKERKNKIKEGLKTAITGEIGLPSKTKSIVDKFINNKIIGIKLHRTPLKKGLMTALNVASGFSVEEKIKKAPYDTLFHLFMCIETDNGSFMIEKNEVINASLSCKLPSGTESRTITEIPENLTVEKALDNTKSKLGGKYLTYSYDNNCQDFIVAFLEANNIGNNNDIAFVKQDTKTLFEGNTTFRKIVNSITQIGSAVSNITGGSVSQNNLVDFKHINWGAFTKQLKLYNSKHNTNLDLHKFAMLVLHSPKDFNKRTLQRARFYLNIVEKSKNGKGFTDFIKAIGSTAGKPYEIAGVNPFNLGFDLGEKVIAPELMKVLPPEKVKKSLGGSVVINKNKKSNNNNIMSLTEGSSTSNKKPNSWIMHVKDFASKNNLKYRDALKDPSCKSSYKSGAGMPTSEETMIAQVSNSENLGVNKKGL